VAQRLECEQDGATTRLTCTRCSTPICPRCFVRTPVGFKCRACTGTVPPGRASGRSRTVVATVAVVLAAAAALVGLRLVGGGDEPLVDESARYSGLSARDVERPFLGERRSEGPLAFTATAFECAGGGESAPAARAPQGRYCTLALTVANTGTEPETFVAAEQFLIDAEARRYRPDDDPELASRVVNPGNELRATLVFDVPESTTPDEAELHRFARSGGVRVVLRPR
jgi:hypothetical protein